MTDAAPAVVVGTLSLAIGGISSDQLQHIRKDVLQLKQKELAALLGYSDGTIGHWEQGHSPIPTVAIYAIRWLVKEKLEDSGAMRMLRVEGARMPGSSKPGPVMSDATSLAGLNRMDNEALEFEHGVLQLALESFTAWVMEYAPHAERTEVSIAKHLGVSTDTLLRWRRGTSLPTNTGRILGTLTRMVAYVESKRAEMKGHSIETEARLRVATKILQAIQEGDEAMDAELERTVKRALQGHTVLPSEKAAGISSVAMARLDPTSAATLFTGAAPDANTEDEDEE